jgi:hypothetical protein
MNCHNHRYLNPIADGCFLVYTGSEAHKHTLINLKKKGGDSRHVVPTA